MKGFKTIAFNIISGILLIAQSQGAELWGLTPEVLTLIILIGNFVLRFLTTTAIGKSI